MSPDKLLQQSTKQIIQIKKRLTITKVKDWFGKLSRVKKIIFLIIIIGIGWFGYTKFFPGKPQIRYQTAQAEKGTLIITVTGSGQVSNTNNSSITTQTSGVVSQVYVKDGDEVKAGDKIAEIDLDLVGQQNAQQVLSSYQTANNNLNSAKANLYTLQSDMFTKWKTYYDTATNSTYQNSDGSPNETNRALAQFQSTNDDWLATEAKYKNQQNVVKQTQTALSAAWLTYQQNSSIIYAPISGVVTGLSLQPGSVISATQNSTTQSSTKIASIKTKALSTITVNLTEIDIPKIKIGNHATIIFDALPDKTFTGKIVSIDTAGVTSSGVTTYPTAIRLDTESNSILPNMAATANIIIDTKNNALLVPSASIQNQNGETFIRILKQGQVQQVPVQTGLSSDTQTEIVSGLSEGDTVVTNILQSARNGNQTTSPFSSIGGGRGFGGGAVRMGR